MIAFLTRVEALKLLKHCGSEIRPSIALMLFAGIRAEEIYRENTVDGEDVLRWEDIDLAQKTIYMRSDVAKARVSRTMRNLPQNLWAWLPAKK